MPVVVANGDPESSVEDTKAAVVFVCSGDASTPRSKGVEAGDSIVPRSNGGNPGSKFDGTTAAAAVVCSSDTPVPRSKGGTAGSTFADSPAAAVV